jgi:hypothetical protein
LADAPRQLARDGFINAISGGIGLLGKEFRMLRSCSTSNVRGRGPDGSKVAAL